MESDMPHCKSVGSPDRGLTAFQIPTTISSSQSTEQELRESDDEEAMHRCRNCWGLYPETFMSLVRGRWFCSKCESIAEMIE
jgi:hypothetical protein